MKLSHKPKQTFVTKAKKPILLMNLGIGWSATTPFMFTLVKAKYCHPGHLKENHYLRMIYEQECLGVDDSYKQAQPAGLNPNLWIFNGWDGMKDLYEYTYHLQDKYDDNRTFIEYFYEKPHTIEKYIEYYKRHSERTRGDFPVVSDWGNHNWSLPYWENGVEMIEKIKEHFDIKVTVQFRDPVRRCFSETGICFHDDEGESEFYGVNRDLEEIWGDVPNLWTGKIYLKARSHNKFFKLSLQNGICNGGNSQYVDLWNRWEKIVGRENMLHIIMEEFWNPKLREQQLERLSNFLDYPIDNIHRNCYYPDKGSDAPQYTELVDQWTSDKETITEETIEYAKKYMKKFYNQWELKFGNLPEEWIHYEN
tara:strand:- start:44 stop:1138 length:1095 start_codon:yes stop_codon:yes gene_type:complete